MPITFPFFLFAKPAENVLRWIRIDRAALADSSLPESSWSGARRRIAERLPPHLRHDVLRDE